MQKGPSSSGNPPITGGFVSIVLELAISNSRITSTGHEDFTALSLDAIDSPHEGLPHILGLLMVSTTRPMFQGLCPGTKCQFILRFKRATAEHSLPHVVPLDLQSIPRKQESVNHYLWWYHGELTHLT